MSRLSRRRHVPLAFGIGMNMCRFPLRSSTSPAAARDSINRHSCAQLWCSTLNVGNSRSGCQMPWTVGRSEMTGFLSAVILRPLEFRRRSSCEDRRTTGTVRTASGAAQRCREAHLVHHELDVLVLDVHHLARVRHCMRRQLLPPRRSLWPTDASTNAP